MRHQKNLLPIVFRTDSGGLPEVTPAKNDNCNERCILSDKWGKAKIHFGNNFE